MKRIEEIDPNFKVEVDLGKDDIEFFDIEQNPFKIYGIYKDGEKFRRLPEDVAKSVSDGVLGLHANTAGGRVRFKTDSPYIAIIAEFGGVGKMPHFPISGSAGFDMYVGDRYTKTFVPPFDVNDGYSSIMDFESSELREITINFPLYSEVKSLKIGLKENSVVSEPLPYKNEKPVVYYGSSITQGGCASRPGMSYQSIISRRLNLDYINLGFSGSAKAEDEMVDYIKNLDMSLFVYDYDHNAPTREHLEKTHEKMFKAIREKNPDLPIIMMSRPRFDLVEWEEKRLGVIKATYNNAVANGDKNVWLITGPELCALCKKEGTVDGCHPTDFGFNSMAQTLGDLMEKIGF